MKRLLTGLFVLLVNFYFTCFVCGLAAGIYANSEGAIRPEVAATIPLFALLLGIAYQLRRYSFSFSSPGEIAIGSISKTDLLVQRRSFSITRVPLFLLLLLTLALPGNFLDNLSSNRTHSLPQLLFLTLLYYCLYLGTRSFFIRPTLFAAAMFASGLALAALLAQSSASTSEPLAIVFLSMAGLWLIAWLVYRRYWLAPSSL